MSSKDQMKHRAPSRALLFAGRTFKEIIRDPLSLVFCLGVPLIMFVTMYFLFSSTEQTGLFLLPSLTPGIAVFAGAFIMLYMALQVSKDRATSFLTRLYTSPMVNGDFVLGYALPGAAIGISQVVICWMTAVVMGLCSGSTDWIRPLPILCAILTTIPVVLCFVFFGILFGSLFSDKAAPSIASIVIAAAGFLSGAWMPVETMAEGFRTFCRCLPFYSAVLAGRTALSGDAPTFPSLWLPLIVTAVWAAALTLAACLAFRFKARREEE